MQILYEKTLEGSDFKLRTMSRDTAKIVGLPHNSEVFFALFFGEPVFRNKRLVDNLRAAIRAFPHEYRNLDSFLEFYEVVLQCRKTRLRKAKATDNSHSIFCSTTTSTNIRDRSGRHNITYTDIKAARVQCECGMLYMWRLVQANQFADVVT